MWLLDKSKQSNPEQSLIQPRSSRPKNRKIKFGKFGLIMVQTGVDQD